MGRLFFQSTLLSLATPHGFFTRHLEKTSDIPALLNLPEGRFFLPHQTHSADVAIIKPPFTQEKPQADGLVTQEFRIILGIVTADCVPILLADAHNHVIGAVHAGWRGALAGIVENTVGQMMSLGAEKKYIRVAIGPAIGFDSYEVGAEFYEKFFTTFQEASLFFKPAAQAKKWLFDLKSFVAWRLAQNGLHHYEILSFDTYRDHTLFHSYRRAQSCKEKNGHCLSAITLA